MKQSSKEGTAHPTHWSPRLGQLSLECQAVGCISLKLCDLTASAGAVLAHSIRVLENLFSMQEPLTFKIGYTHNPIWRWGNDIYGYRFDRNKWSNMVIIYYAKEPYSPAMLEAALIEKYRSIFEATNDFCLCCFLFLLFFRASEPLSIYIIFIWWVFLRILFANIKWRMFFENCQPTQGRPGCKNIKAGGDTVIPELSASDSRFMTYVVYRSFKVPPPIKPLDDRRLWHCRCAGICAKPKRCGGRKKPIYINYMGRYMGIY